MSLHSASDRANALPPREVGNTTRRAAWRALAHAGAALLVLSSVSILAACGGSDDTSGSETARDAGTKTTTANGGASGGTAITTPPPPQPVACGASMCTPPTNPLSGIISMFGGGALGGAVPMASACCLDESTGTCGISTGMGATCEALATADARCPAADLGMLGGLLGGASMSGCCIDDKCGQDGRLFGRGCVENSEAMSMIAGIPLIGGMVKFPGARACDAPAQSDTDAGVEDGQDAGL